MKKFLFLFMTFTSFIPFKLKADEGMWFLMFIERLNHRDMQKMGLQLTSEEIYSINNHSLKDAIVQFNNGCTAEIISKTGLVLTNHHCGYDAIAELSTPEKNILKDGFWAKNNSEELKPKSLSVRFFVRMDNVTQRILSKINNKMSESEREKVINQEVSLIEKENNEGGKYIVSVRSFFQGNEYYYFVYQDFTDVRLVGTPTESIGKFGGDTDNWEWPRHTGDFSMFRVYSDINGNPAPYSVNNVPLKPKHHLPINISGVKENDFAMILGYPGRTNRWMPASGVEQNIKFAYPAWVEASKTAMDKMKPYMEKDEAIKLKYASKYARLANYWKNRQGMIDALTKHQTVKTKRKVEDKFNSWAKKKENKEEFSNIIKDINNFYLLTNNKSRHDNYLNILLRSSSYASISRNLAKDLEEYSKANPTEKQNMLAKIKSNIETFFNESYIPTEKEILTAQLELYSSKAKTSIAPKVQELINQKQNISEYVNTIIDKSLFYSPEKLNAFLQNPDENLIKNDELYKLSTDLISHLNKKNSDLEKAQDAYSKGFRKLVKGLQDSKLSNIKYPDANSTLRLTYGKVRSLPKDSKNDADVNNYTTLTGMVNKYKPNDDEFDLPQRLLDLNKTKNYGNYADKNGNLAVNFLTDNDITGGNSGSPVLNKKGELIGLAFDGNIEAMAGDVIFDKNLQRTINVDARFILWLIDVYSNNQNIINELTIVK